MKILKCDLCEEEVEEVVSVEVFDGEHPHNGSPMHNNIDCCFNCLKHIKGLKCDIEFFDLKSSALARLGF